MQQYVIKELAFTPSEAVSALVNTLMQEDRGFHPNLGGITQGGMSNHFPMTVMSMAGLKATDEQIHLFKRNWPRYRAHVEHDLGLTDSREISLENWHLFLGQASRLLEFRRVFQEGLETQGVDVFVTHALDTMGHSLPMGLFHPVIQLSFALMHGDRTLIANALAYMAIRYFDLYHVVDLPESTPRSDSTTLSAWKHLAERADEISLHFVPNRGSLHICERLCAEPDLHRLAFDNGFSIHEENLHEKMKEMTQAAIRLYLHEPALTTLHAVTSSQALVDITQRFAKGDLVHVYVRLWKLMWIWISGLYFEKGHPTELPQVSSDFEETEWSAIVKRVLIAPEVHQVKMVFSCKWLYENLEANELYRAAAINVAGN